MKKITNHTLRQRVLERLLFEMYDAVMPYGRNFKTVDNDPYSYKDVPGIQIEEYAGEDGGYWVKIDVEPMPELSTPSRLFRSHEDAESFLRKNVEEIKVKLMNRQR